MEMRETMESHEPMNQSKLKPCPFCGGKPHMQTLLQNDSFVYYIICPHCDSAGLRSFEKEKAIGRWNTRHYPPVKRMEVIRKLDGWNCPVCDAFQAHEIRHLEPYCSRCGQALDWSEE